MLDNERAETQKLSRLALNLFCKARQTRQRYVRK